MIRALRLEIVKPLDEPWDSAGTTLRTLAKATPKLLNAAMDARIAIAVAGRDEVKAKIAPDAKAESGDGLAYQAVLRACERLRAWGQKKNHAFATLDVPGGMASAIARSASMAFAKREQTRPHFAGERVIVRKQETSLAKDTKGISLTVGLRAGRGGAVRFAVAHSFGAHKETLARIVSKALPHGDCKIQWDERRKKWYALVAYEPSEPAPVRVDVARTLAVHRGVRNAIYLLPSTGERGIAMPGAKYLAQRRSLQMRMREVRRVSMFERGAGAKGHGKARRFESYDALEGKLARATHTFCQQAAAFVAATAKRLGCGVVVIEDYGGIEANEDPQKRRVLDRFPLDQLKKCIEFRMERDGLTLREASSAYISSTCPRCAVSDTRAHNARTGIFHCRVCIFERPADWVAAYWMLTHGGADMSVWVERLRRERELAAVMNSVKEDS